MIFFKYLFIFCLFSVVGWILELLFRSITQKRFINPGFMSGCVVPIYGFGAVFMNIICTIFGGINYNYKAIFIFVISLVVLSALEFIAGFILLKFFHLKLWDYSGFKYNYKGFICLEFSMIWGFLALVFYNFIFIPLQSLCASFIANDTCLFLLGIFIGIFLIDLFVSIELLNRLNKYAKSIKQIVNVERLKFDIRRKNKKRKFLNAIYPYVSTNKFLREKIKDEINKNLK